MNGSTSSQESAPRGRKWYKNPKNKNDASQKKDEKVKIKAELSPLHGYISMPKANEIDLIESS